VTPCKEDAWVWDPAANRIVRKTITFTPGLYHIFDEILVNAVDNKRRDASMTRLAVSLDAATGWITVINNGAGIPVEVHGVHGLYIPELIFGELLSSSNYDDTEARLTGGRNGYGAKLTNIYSTEFRVEVVDGRRGLHYTQRWSGNMGVRDPPVVKPTSRKTDTVTVAFHPDYARFGMAAVTGLDADATALFYRRVYDVAGITPATLKVTLNGAPVPVTGFKQYTALYALGCRVGDDPPDAPPTPADLPSSPSPALAYCRVNDAWEVAVGTVPPGKFTHISFVNGLYTPDGGRHVEYVCDQIVAAVRSAYDGTMKGQGAEFRPAHLKSSLALFVNALVVNPAFDVQTKRKLTTPVKRFGSTAELPAAFLKTVVRQCMDGLLLKTSSIAQKQLKKMDGGKRATVSVPKLDDANWAGTAKSARCTLFLTEGDSAKALVVSGFSVVGRDAFGVFPLKGKLLNVQDASHAQVTANVELQHLVTILGLQFGREYASVSSLRYGSCTVMADQDHDGSHIKGLVLNFFLRFWPSLLRIPGFLKQFITPIVKCSKHGGTKVETFYTIPQFRAWAATPAATTGKWTMKYFKGLGTSTSSDAKEYFRAIHKHLIPFVHDPDTEASMALAFVGGRKAAEDRKVWLSNVAPGVHVDYAAAAAAGGVTFTSFVHQELVAYCMANNVRSIPSVVDGLKPSQRKVLHACFKRRLHEEIKVAQLVGYVSEHTAYHHGEEALAATIVGMAHTYVGSRNNVNLLYPSGQFGTRLVGGKDAASPRYIFTRLESAARVLFHPADDPVLTYLHDDDQAVEPEFFVPVIPTLLVNGAEGIGTGWATSVPCFNPVDVVAAVRGVLAGNPCPGLVPWFKGFTGTMTLDADGKRAHATGVAVMEGDRTCHVTELPVFTWTQDFKERVERLCVGEDASVRQVQDKSTDTQVHFVVELSEDAASRVASGTTTLVDMFGLRTTIHLTNMVLFDAGGRLRRYDTPAAIVAEFVPVRLRMYGVRQEHLLRKLELHLAVLEAKARFIALVVSGALVIARKSKPVLEAELLALGFPAAQGPGGYDHLLGLPLWHLTLERMQKLEGERDDARVELRTLASLTPTDLWLRDLDDVDKLEAHSH